MDTAYTVMWKGVPHVRNAYRIVKVWLDEDGELNAKVMGHYSNADDAQAVVRELNDLFQELCALRERERDRS